MIRIAFGHQARVGKDYACQYLSKKLGAENCQILHFSDPLYRILHFAQETCDFPVKKDRKFLQSVGTWARDQNRNVWANALLQSIKPDKNILVGDLRFKNEMALLRKAGFTCIKIVRDSRPLPDNPNHQSEIDLLDSEWDYIIENNGSQGEFQNCLDKILAKIV